MEKMTRSSPVQSNVIKGLNRLVLIRLIVTSIINFGPFLLKNYDAPLLDSAPDLNILRRVSQMNERMKRRLFISIGAPVLLGTNDDGASKL